MAAALAPYAFLQGVVPEYVSMVTELESGVCIAIEIEGDGANVQPDFRAICGPMGMPHSDVFQHTFTLFQILRSPAT